MGFDREKIRREVKRMLPRVRESGLPYDEDCLQRIIILTDADTIDDYALVREVESLF